MVEQEELLDCIMDIDKILDEAESALEEKNYRLAREKLKEARDAIEDVREDDDAQDDKEIESKLMDKLK